ncbi:helix-turn-helix transcriptional regulator [Micromonospora krabiensis]|uniref:Predicted DNA-binding transcriptional regulator YafY, contains an HTH and WYL domains n=1 Tax=Micromonospora krabiensis TaxID=307121 RepID=A0A1C3NCE7_9ACTN|nr:WYL domain-containing protein [Micromonospora krabiensis]SBV30218.1 Predicted DNA-binding transcriptional regulator YafY, contains an HTH and WYL domains [Micromonospora krabiensis]
MRASRLLSLLLLLQNRGRMSATQLAAELGVTARTVYRDVEALATAGVPIYAEQGPAGGYQLMDGYRTRLTGMTADEAESLFLTGMPQPAAELGLGAQVAAAELKLMAALPTPYRDASMRIRQRFHLDARGWYREPDAVPHLLAVAEALWQDQTIEVRYRRWAPRPGEVTRRLHPLGLVLKAGVWYLVAAGRGQPRTYRVSAIVDLRPLPETVTRPDSFDLADFWRAHVERYERADTDQVAVVRLTPNGVTALPDVLGPKAARLALHTLTPADRDGWHQATIPMENVPHTAATLLRLGPNAQALAPTQLVAHLTDTIQEMARLYPA